MQQPNTSNKGPKACTTCARAKARCIPGPGDDEDNKCERCYRLNRECISQQPAPPRAKKQPKRSKVAELEKRLNELSSQFDGGRHADASPTSPTTSGDARRSNTSQGGTAIKASPTREEGGLTFSHLFPTQHPQEQRGSVSSGRRRSSAAAGGGLSGAMGGMITGAAASSSGAGEDLSPRSGTATPSSGSWTSLWPTQSESAVMLQEYHRACAHVFPFVVVPEAMTPEFRIYRPFLWKAVMMVTCFFDGPRQVKLGEEMLSDIARATVVDGVKTLDLLQGVQLLVGWFNYALKSSQLTNLLFLARSMCVNLGVKGADSIQQEAKSGNLDQLRAYAGTYYLNTLVFTTNKRTDVLMNTSHLEACCNALETAQQYPSDEYLVKLVKIQQIAQSISLTMAFEPGQPAMQLPLTMVVQSFQVQLDRFRTSLPDHLKDNATLQSHISIAEILLMEIATSDQHCSSSFMPLTDRLQLLWACVRAIRSYLTVRFASLDLEMPRFICLTAADVAFVLLTGIKLLALKLPGWEAGHIHAEMRLGDMVDRQVEELTVLTARRRGDTVGIVRNQTFLAESFLGKAGVVVDPFDRLLKLLLNVRQVLGMWLRNTTAASAAAAAAAAGIDASVDDAAGDFQMQDFGQMELDDDFWQELLNDKVWSVNDFPVDMGGL